MMKTFPLTIGQEKLLNVIREKSKSKMNSIKDWHSAIRYTIIEGVQKKGKAMENLSETTHRIEEQDIMSEEEAKELENWFNGEILRGSN